MLKIKEIKINIPKFPKEIIDTLQSNGYEAYIVGGCVRDSILGKKPSDYDITTSASPQTIKKLFKRTIDTGIKHGTVTVLFYENNKSYTYEVTTFRIDGEYDDSRHPRDVVFVNNLKEDLLRRDFTVNAMAYNDIKGLVDEYGGIVDLSKKIIRAVGNPEERFSEDALRLLRAVRFSAKLGFEIDEDTKSAIPKLASKLANVSKERIQVELTKTITSENPNYVNRIFELNLARYISLELENIKSGNIDKCLPIYTAYSCLFYNTDVEKVIKIIKDIKLDNSNSSKIVSLLKAKTYYTKLLNTYKNKSEYLVTVKELINFLGYELVYDFIKILSINEKNNEIIDNINKTVVKLELDKCPIFLRDLDISGDDLISLGFTGQEIGIALSELLKIVHKNRHYNNKKLLQEILKKAYNIYKGEAYEL